MYRLILESLLGLRLEGDRLSVSPCVPMDWTQFKVHYRYRETMYHITVLQNSSSRHEMSVTIDGVERDEKGIHLIDDRQEHAVVVTIPMSADTAPHGVTT